MSSIAKHAGTVVCRCMELCRELGELKLEHKALDRQLLDAVSQKLQLSQQLEAWQVCLCATLWHRIGVS